MSKDPRFDVLTSWIASKFDQESCQLIALNGDAGFRRYFRFTDKNQSYIAVDSPKDKCNNVAFIAIGRAFSSEQVKVPKIIHYDADHGFFCLEDLGEQLLADCLTGETMDKLYRQAIDMLPTISRCQLNSDYQLPDYDRAFVTTELNIFTEWLVGEYLRLTLTDQEQHALNQAFDLLITNAIEQPQVTMHRDYHSRNIMMTDAGMAVIDFQDAVLGPITYDIVSLLRDCYVRWPAEQVAQLFDYYLSIISEQTAELDICDDKWRRWFDLMGIQRHLKASGIFARLYLRDGKPSYLPDIPLTLEYIEDISGNYSELKFLTKFIRHRVKPALAEKQQ